MKKHIVSAFILFVCLLSFQGRLEATFPTFDAVNASLSEIRNDLMQSQFAQDIALGMQRLEQLKAAYSELLRFNSGLDNVFEVLVGDPLGGIVKRGSLRARDAFNEFGWMQPKIELLEGSSHPADIRSALEDITGEIPASAERPYIPFEEMQVVDGFQLAREIRDAGADTRDAAQQISTQAETASPKGAARLGVEAMSQMMLLSQQNQEALAKMIELEATQVEQVSRDEKRFERERLRYMREFQEGLESLGRPQ